MPQHRVTMQLPKDLIRGSDVVFSIKENGKKLGELHVSQGNVEWWPANHRTKKHRLSWSELSQAFINHG